MLLLLHPSHHCIATLLHRYMSGIHMLTPYLLRANYINYITTAPLYCWPLYVKYSYTYSVLITSILSLLHRCNTLHYGPIAPLHYCINIPQVVSYSYNFVNHFYISQSYYCRTATSPTTPKWCLRKTVLQKSFPNLKRAYKRNKSLLFVRQNLRYS